MSRKARVYWVGGELNPLTIAQRELKLDWSKKTEPFEKWSNSKGSGTIFIFN